MLALVAVGLDILPRHPEQRLWPLAQADKLQMFQRLIWFLKAGTGKEQSKNTALNMEELEVVLHYYVLC